MVSHWNLSNNKSPQVSRILCSILADLNNAVVWMVFTHPLISKSSSSYINPLVTVPRAPITIGITVTFMFHSFFNSLVRSRYLSFFLFAFNFTLWSGRKSKSTILQVLVFLLIIIRSGRLAEIRRSVCITHSTGQIVCLILQDRFWVVHIPFVLWTDFSFLHNSLWITLPTQSCLFLYTFCANC